MFNADKHMDHTAYQRSLKTKDNAALRFIIADCREAMDANPSNPNAGYYADEIHYAAAELRRRAQQTFAEIASN